MIYFACAKCDIETCSFSDIIFAHQNSRSEYHLDEVQISLRSNITRRKANITEKTTSKKWFFLAGAVAHAKVNLEECGAFLGALFAPHGRSLSKSEAFEATASEQ